MPCGFEHLTSIVPKNKKTVAVLAHEVGIDESVLDATLKNGLYEVPYAAGETTASLAAKAITQLFTQRPDLQPRVQAVILAHSLPAPVPPNFDLLAPCLEAGKLDLFPAIAVTGQPCAILHSAIQMAQTWLSGLPASGGILIVGSDVPSQTEERLFFNSAMGDAAIAGVLVKNTDHHVILASITDTYVRAFSGELSPTEAIAGFRAANPNAIRKSAESCLSAAGVQLNDLKWLVPHTPNTPLWTAVAELMRLPQERILTDYIGETGHLNSNDSFAHYLRAIEEGKLAKGDLALLVNPGFGGSRGCTIMRV